MARPKHCGPRAAVRVPKIKRLTADVEPVIGDRGPLSWKFSSTDSNGPFAWTNLTDPAQLAEVISKLKEFEGQNWSQLTATGSHPISISTLHSSAQDRLQELRLDEYDELMSLRLTGRIRIWAYWVAGQENIMRLLWWDPEHQVYPVKKDKADRRKSRRR